MSADSENYAVIEAMWTLEPCGANRKTFFDKVQRLWKGVYSQSGSACRELFAKAGKLSGPVAPSSSLQPLTQCSQVTS